jgi:hypothetical protein
MKQPIFFYFQKQNMSYPSRQQVFASVPSITNIQNNLLIKRLKKRIITVEKQLFENPTITIEGCENLRGIPGQDWRSRILALFTDAHLSHSYIVDMQTTDIINEIPTSVTITVVTHHVKNYAYSSLILFLTNHHKNVNVIKH